MKKYNHAFNIAFSFENDDPKGNVSPEDLMKALKDRVAYFENNMDELVESCGAPFDSYEVDSGSRNYGYYINLDERGDFYADVRDSSGVNVFEIRAGSSLDEDDSSIFDDGFMRDKHDLSGLTEYLRDLGVIPRDAKVLSSSDFEADDGDSDGDAGFGEQPPPASTPYSPARIAYELQKTAMGELYYGSALRAAKDFLCVTPADRDVLDRWATGGQGDGDFHALQDIAVRIRASNETLARDLHGNSATNKAERLRERLEARNSAPKPRAR